MPTPLAPLMLFGATAVAVPIALHFFYKARYKPLPWAAMSFLKQSVEQTSRRLKFQEWVLLALRCLVLLLLALALARPASQSAAAAGRGESVDAVLVFDTSYSMGAQDGDNKPRPDRATDAALGVLDGLPPYSTVQIFACADRATLLGPVSRGNIDQARQLIKTIEPTGLSTDFLPGFAAALPVLDAGIAPSREVYLFSDLQKSGFERQLGALRAKCEELRAGTPQGNGRPRETSLIFVRCSAPNRVLKNVAVKEVTMPTVIPHSDTRVPFDVLVRNTGKEPIENVKVSLGFKDSPLTREEKVVPLIEPEQTIPVTLTGKLEKAGPRLLTVEVSGDDLPGDNQYQQVILVRDKVNVLVVDGTPDTRNPADSGSHYVVNALAPVTDAVRKDYFIHPTVVSPAEGVTPAMLSNIDVVYLLNVPSSSNDKPGVAGLTPEFAEALAGFVRNGGGLVIGLGDLVVPERYNATFGSGGSKLLPFDLGELSVTAAEYPYTPAPESVDPSSYLKRFADAPFSSVLKNVSLTRLFKAVEGGAGGRTLVKTANGLPLVASRYVGEGEVVLVTTSLDSRWGSFSSGDVMIPFTFFTLSELTGRRVPGGTKTAGEAVAWSPPEATKPFELIRPDGSRLRLGLAQAAAGQRLTVSSGDTAVPGVYALVPEGEPADKGATFAVNPDGRESQNLDTASEKEMTDWLGFAPFVVQAGAGTEAAVGQQRVSSEWTEWLLLLLLVFLVAESAWAWFCGKAW